MSLALTALEPLSAATLFPGLGRRLIALLRSLSTEDWNRPTVCTRWSVRDIAAHLLDSALRRIAAERDGFVLPPRPGEVGDYASLVGFLDRLNDEWVVAHQRLSPGLLTELLEWVEPQLATTLEALDPNAPARFPVSWAGEDESKCWFDVARELTERWLHQQQIRLAVGVEPLRDPALSRPVFDTFLRALPYRYGTIEADPETALEIQIEGAERYAYILRREPAKWRLLRGSTPAPTTTIRLAEETAWLLLTKGVSGGTARASATVEGEGRLADPFFDVLAIMA